MTIGVPPRSRCARFNIQGLAGIVVLVRMRIDAVAASAALRDAASCPT
jgi:hypothetical protein